ncbi:heparan-alpha-glucosaminide N-acetyltransferase domain-containing protein [Microbacterium sp. SA39]|uniref:heparan-alpha-glucosaminide N-acetyltransferase domain-containing protein n=1 Tax=Microbacterium sp. SA39 TaxID=1263625 RepID=UPI0005F9B114|nr:heparan-alpha-glucosaminide N-acetyltransferase domain-containing protein [Microbacterium sp. SA39]KJQ53867.1 hypothetical protein RS85_02419 [Microbacterium sp. SA39]
MSGAGLDKAIAGRVRTNWRRLNAADRTQGVDLARGLAVLGMLAAHLLVIASFDWVEPASWIAVVQGRSSILFATLAGVSLGLVAGSTTPIRGAGLRSLRLRLARRALLIWLIGVVVSTLGVPVYVILPAYGILFLLALPALAATRDQLIVLAAAIALVMPAVQTWLDAFEWWETDEGRLASWLLGWNYPFLVWAAFMFAGLALARCHLNRLRTQVSLLVIGAALMLLGYGLAALVRPASTPADQFWSRLLTADAHSSGLFEVIGSGGFAIAVIAICLLLSRTGASILLFPLRAVGSMPLTAYVLQLLAWALIAGATLDEPGDLAAFRALEPFLPFALGTLVFCTLWALFIGRGPLERALGLLTTPTDSTRVVSTEGPHCWP